MANHLQITLLGDFSIAADGMPISGINSERLQALLAFLVLHRAAPQPRSHIAVQLWPEATDGDAKANLLRRLHELKQLIPDSDLRLRIDTKTIQWCCTDHCRLDVAEFEDGLAQYQQSQTLAIWSGR